MAAPLIPAAGLVVEEVGDEVCLYRTDVNEVLVLNTTAADVWRLIDGQLTTGDIIERLTAAYAQDDAEVVGADVTKLVEDLQARGFLSAGGPSYEPAS